MVRDNRSDSLDSADEALSELLGINFTELYHAVKEEKEETDSIASLWRMEDQLFQEAAKKYAFRHHYESEGIVIFPKHFSIPADAIRRLTNELVHGTDRFLSDKTYETIQVLKNGQIEHRRTLTRLENFVSFHPEWNRLCNDYLARLVSVALGEQYVLYKEKLNLKPPGGSGFAPHLDTPSLKVALGEAGPSTFVTVVVAIDSMNSENGCMQFSKGQWNEKNCVQTIVPDKDGNPDGGGRAGAIPSEINDTLVYTDLVCQGGTVAAFSGYTPHRSASNISLFPRRAVFLTYNPASQGDFHRSYYDKMEKLRNDWRRTVGLLTTDERQELDALATIPKI